LLIFIKILYFSELKIIFMKSSWLKKIVAASVLLIASIPQSQAQFGVGIPNFFKRFELGYSYTVGFATYSSVERVKNPGNETVYENNIKENVRSKFGYGGLMGSYIPLKRVGNSLMAIGVNFQYNAFLWDYTTPVFQNWVTNENGEITGAYYSNDFGLGFSSMSVQMAVPVSLDFKFGAEASLQKAAKFTGTIGAGVYPSANMTVDFDNGGFGFGVSPFVKGEIGIKGGILWKLRAQYVMGRIPFYTDGNSIGGLMGSTNSSELIGKGVASVSLVFMPFSWNFREDGWWNWHR